MPDPLILKRNLAALSGWSVETAELILAAEPAAIDPTAQTGIADDIELPPTYAVVVVGFGSGVRDVLVRMATPPALRKRHGGVVNRKGDPLFRLPVIVYEPDPSRVRAVLDRVDMAEAIAAVPLVIVTDPGPASIAAALYPYREAVAMGTYIVDCGAPSGRIEFVRNLADFVTGARLDVHTSCELTPKTFGNSIANAERYATCPGIADLQDAAKGIPALCIAAGPSLDGTLEALRTPGLKDRFVIVAAQTVLKILLREGIRPHFVTALDHHDICRKFYDGLTASDVAGVQLVARPQCSPAILDAFPGVTRLYRDDALDSVLGPDLARPMGSLSSGGSVAHLSYYLARYMGCDPVVLVGHDLAFTGGKHYATGAGIVNRDGVELHPVADIHGGIVHTDTQMLYYLQTFQREFAADAANGLTTLDATGGGARKQHAEPVPLSSLVWWDGPRTPTFTSPPVLPTNPAVARRVAGMLADMERARTLIRRGDRLVERLMRDPGNERIIGVLHRVRERALSLGPALSLAHYVSASESLRRLRRTRLAWLGREPGRPTESAHRP